MDETVDDDVLAGLDDAQRQAATTLEGPVRIVACAGAGKTRTITRRIAYACTSGVWDARGVLAVTFSVKAAAEMRARLASLGVGDQVTAATFHSAALHQLRRVWPDVCGEAPFPHVTNRPHELTANALRRTINPEGLDPSQTGSAAVRDVLAEINWCKVQLVAPDDYARVCAAVGRRPPIGLEAGQFADVYTAYEIEKSSKGEIDFNDILLMVCHVIDDDADAARVIRSSIRWLTVDEYQDVSPLQHRLLTRWLGDNRNICVVGDPAQTIYSFAGASSYDLLHFTREFAPVAADVSLRTDYRSTPQIVGYANRVLAASPERGDYLRLESGRGDGSRVASTRYADDEQEAQGVATRIARLIAQGVPASDIAVLSRINAQQQPVCAALRAQGVRFRVRRDAGWQASSLADDAQEKAAMLEALGIAGTKGAVTVSTIHASKGLEFKHVFLIGCSEGLLPYGSPAPGEALEEERRLMYVGVTRAEDTLHLSFADRQSNGSGVRRRPSRFLA